MICIVRVFVVPVNRRFILRLKIKDVCVFLFLPIYVGLFSDVKQKMFNLCI